MHKNVFDVYVAQCTKQHINDHSITYSRMYDGHTAVTTRREVVLLHCVLRMKI